jgi:FkbH-like protein
VTDPASSAASTHPPAGAAPNAQVKLVIWDLDETFWTGVLGEGPVELPERRARQIRELVDRGVMVSVCSRNDEAAARAELERAGLWELVIFPRINLEAKGAQVRDIIEAAQLRPANVLFVDDNHLNREEVAWFATDIQLADPADPGFDDLIDAFAASGKPDPEHKRLGEYRHLETRAGAAADFVDNTEFLRSSEIVVELRPVAAADAERIQELIQRTNQLNYTKRRVDLDAVRALITDPATTARAVRVRDRFGDYGLVGFAAARDGRIEQLAFSCRILGMGVERAVYERLGRPAIEVAEPVSAPLQGPPTDWLTLVEAGDADVAPAQADPEIALNTGVAAAPALFVGGCDLEATVGYLARGAVTTYFNFSTPERPRLTVHRDSIDFLLSDLWPAGAKETVLAEVPFLEAKVFDVPRWRDFPHIVYSPLIDYVQAKYARAGLPGVLVSYGDVLAPQVDEPRIRQLADEYGVDEAGLRVFAERWHPIEKPDDVWLAQLRELFGRMEGAETVTALLGAGTTFDGLDEERLPFHRHANELVERAAADFPNVRVLAVDPLLHDRSDFTNGIRHYGRRVYRDLAVAVAESADIPLREAEPKAAPKPPATPAARARRLVGRGLRRIGIAG